MKNIIIQYKKLKAKKAHSLEDTEQLMQIMNNHNTACVLADEIPDDVLEALNYEYNALVAYIRDNIPVNTKWRIIQDLIGVTEGCVINHRLLMYDIIKYMHILNMGEYSHYIMTSLYKIRVIQDTFNIRVLNVLDVEQHGISTRLKLLSLDNRNPISDYLL